VYLQPNNYVDFTLFYFNGGLVEEDLVARNASDLSQGLVPYRRLIYDTSSNEAFYSETRDAAFYIQDAWHVADRLTINAGVRADVIRRVDRLFDVVTQNSTSVGPRVGANYALTPSYRDVVRASWGRVHDVITRGDVGTGSHDTGYREEYDINLDGVFDTVFVTPETTSRTTNVTIDTGRTQPYIDEWAVGYRRQLAGRLTADVSFLQRKYANQVVRIERNGIYEGGLFRGYADPEFNDLFQITNNKWNSKIYSGLEVQVTKETAALRWIASYTRAWRHLDGTWLPNDPASFIQPQAFANNKGINSAASASNNSLDGNGGDNISWHDHTLRGGVVYFAPWQIVVAASYTVQSGIYGGPVFMALSQPDPSFGPPTLISNGRLVSNPLATVTRLVGPTRSDGQLQAPTLQIWNLRLGRNISFGKDQRVELSADIFNLTNGATDQTFQGSNLITSSSFGRTGLRQPPRSLRVTARVAF
jgi:hypothetical protein